MTTQPNIPIDYGQHYRDYMGAHDLQSTPHPNIGRTFEYYGGYSDPKRRWIDPIIREETRSHLGHAYDLEDIERMIHTGDFGSENPEQVQAFLNSLKDQGEAHLTAEVDRHRTDTEYLPDRVNIDSMRYFNSVVRDLLNRIPQAGTPYGEGQDFRDRTLHDYRLGIPWQRRPLSDSPTYAEGLLHKLRREGAVDPDFRKDINRRMRDAGQMDSHEAVMNARTVMGAYGDMSDEMVRLYPLKDSNTRAERAYHMQNITKAGKDITHALPEVGEEGVIARSSGDEDYSTRVFDDESVFDTLGRVPVRPRGSLEPRNPFNESSIIYRPKMLQQGVWNP